MVTIRNELDCEALRIEALWAYGTAEGVRKAWDTRGRGKQARAAVGVLKKASPARRAAKLVKRYESLGKKIGKAAVKLEHSGEVRSLAGKTLHFFRALGDWIEPYRNLKDLVVTAGLAVWGVIHEAAVHAVAIHGVLTWAMSHIAPVISHVQTVASGMGMQ